MDSNLPQDSQNREVKQTQPNTPPPAGQFVYPNNQPPAQPPSGAAPKDANEIFGEASGASPKSGYNPLSQFSQAVSFNKEGEVMPQEPIEEPDTSHIGKRPSRLKTTIWALATIVGVIALVGGITYTLLKGSSPKSANTGISTNQYQVGTISLSDLAKSNSLTIDQNQQLDVNGQLRVNNSLVLTATDIPANPQTGQLLLSKDGKLQYYNGVQFIPVATSINGAAGTLSAGPGIGVVGSTIANTGVVTIQGQSGNVTLLAGQGISINGATITNTGLASVTGQNGLTVNTNGGNVTISLPQNIAASSAPTFQGLTLAGLTGNSVVGTDSNGTLSSITPASSGLCLVSTINGPQFGSCTGQSTVTSLNGLSNALTIAAGSGLVVTDNGTDTITIASTGGTGVTSLNGASGALTVADATQSGGTITIQDASTAQKGLVEVAGTTLVISGGIINTQQQLDTSASPSFNSLTLSNALSVASGGTGAATFTDHGLLIGHGTSPVTALSTGSNGYCLLSQGASADPQFAACPVGGNVATGANHTGGTIAMFDPTNNQQIVDSILTQSSGLITVGGNLTIAGGSQINGSGAGLTNLNAGTINTGTLADARLSSNVALLDRNGQIFTGANEIKVDSTTAFQIQKSDGTGNLFVGDTVNGIIGVGKVPTLTDVPLQVNGAAQFLATTGVTQDAAHNGSIYYDSTDGKFKIIEGGQEKVLCNTVNQSCGAGAADINLQNAYAGGANATITTSDARDLTVNLSDTATDANFITNIQGTSTGKFAIQKASADIFKVVVNPSAVVTINGDLTVNTGTITGDGGGITNLQAANLSGTVAIANGGTGAADAATARTNLSAAASGANSDITSLSAVTSVANASSTLTVGDLGQQLILQGSQNTVLKASNGTNTISVGFSTIGLNNATYQFDGNPSHGAGTYTVCTTDGNCTGNGAGTTNSGNSNSGYLALFDTNSDITASVISQSSGNLTVNNGTATTSLTLGQASTSTGKLLFKNASSAFTTTLQSGNPGADVAFTLPSSAGLSGQCLTTNGSGVLSFATCLSGSGSGGGVTDLNTFTGSVTIQGTANRVTVSNSGGTITLSAPQDIATTSTPSFAGINATGSAGLKVGTAGPSGTSGTITFYDSSSAFTVALQPAALSSSNKTITIPNATGTLAVSASGNIALSAAGNITFTGTLGVANGGTGATTASGARTNLGAAASGANADITSTTALNTITPSAALTVGSTTQQLLLQGSAATTFTATSGSFTTTVGFLTPTTNNAINFPNAAGTVCLSAPANNCGFVSGSVVTSLQGSTGALSLTAGTGISISGLTITNNGVTGVSGTANQILVNGSTGTSNGNVALTLPQDIATTSNVAFGTLTVGSNSNLGKVTLGDGSSAFTATLQPATQGANHTITVPNATGTIAVSAAGPLSLNATTGALSLGTVGVANGGTGLTATPTNGQLLIGNTSTGGFTLATLTAGSNITVTNGNGSIQIDAPNAGSCTSCANQTLSNLTSPTSINVDLKTSAGTQNLGGGLSTNSFANAYIKTGLYLGVNSTGTNYFQLTGTTSPTGARTVNLDDLSGRVVLAQQTTTPTAQNGTISLDNTQSTSSTALTVANSSGTNSGNTLTVTNAGGGIAISATSTGTALSATSTGLAGTAVSYTGSQTTGTVESITGNSLTTGTALNITANALTSGKALNVTSTSSALSGSLVNFSNTYAATSAGTITPNTLNVSRSLSTNISGGITYDTGAGQAFASSTSWTLPNYTAGSGGSTSGLMMIVAVEADAQSATAPSNVTYAGVSLGANIGTTTALGITQWLYKLASPSTAANQSLVVTFASATVGKVAMTTWAGVSSAGTAVASSQWTCCGSTATASNAVTTVGGDVVVDSALGSGTTGSSIAPGAGQTSRISGAVWAVSSIPAQATSLTTSDTLLSNALASISIPLHPTSIPGATLTTAAASISSNCTVTAGYCLDSSGVLSLTQSYASATGGVLSIQNAGLGPDIQLGSGVIRPASNSTSAIKIQNASGSSTAFMVDTTNNRVRIGSATVPSYPLDVTGDINISSGSLYRINGTQIASTDLSDGASLVKLGASASGSATTTFNQTNTTTNGLNLVGSQTTAVALALTANSLTTGGALTVGTTSNSYASGNLVSITQSETFSTANQTTTNSLLNVARTNTTNITGALPSLTMTNSTFCSCSSLSATVSAGTNRLLLVTFPYQYSTVPTAVTYGGVSLTSTNSGYTWYLLNPTVGTATVTITGGASLLPTVTSWYGADQTTPVTTMTTDSYSCVKFCGGNYPSTVTQSVSTGDYMFDTEYASGNTPIPGTGQTTLVSSTSKTTYKVAGSSDTSLTMSMTNSAGTSTSQYIMGYVVKQNAQSVGIQSGAVASFSSSCTNTAGLCSDSGNVLSLNQSYSNASGAVLSIQNSGTGAAIKIQNTSTAPDLQLSSGIVKVTTDSTQAIQIKSSAGTTKFSFDTTNGRLAIGSSSAASYPLDVTGIINSSSGYYISGVSINTGGTLSNIAYKDSGNTFTAGQTITTSATSLSVTSTSTSASAAIITSSNQTGTGATGASLAVVANSLTTGAGLSVTSSSANITTASLISASHTATYTTAVSPSSSLLSLNRSLTANISGTGVSIDTANIVDLVKTTSGAASTTFTVGSFTNKVMLALVDSGSATSLPTSVTYNGVTMTSLGSVGSTRKAQIFYLKDSSLTVGSATFSYTCPSGWCTSRLATFYNVDQSTTFGSIATSSGTTSSETLSVPSNSGDLVVDDLSGTNTGCGSASWSIVSGQSALGSSSSGGAVSDCFGSNDVGGYYSTKNGSATSTSMSWTSSSGAYSHIGVALKPASVGTLALTGSAASISSTCATTAGACTDSSNILNLNQQYTGATGAVLALQNAGSGAAISLTQTGSSTIDIQLAQGNIQTAAGTTSTGVKLQSGAASSGSSGTTQVLTGSGTTGTGAITIQTGNASAGAAGNITIDTGTFTSGTPTISIGTTNASAISIGRSGQATTVNGTLTVTQAVTFSSTLSVKAVTINGHITTGNTSGSTTAAAHANAGTSATCSVSGNDTGGQITLVTGSASWASGVQCTITFAASYATVAPHPVITPANGTDVSAVKPYVDVPGSTPFTTFTINFVAADTGANTYKFNYFNAQ